MIIIIGIGMSEDDKRSYRKSISFKERSVTMNSGDISARDRARLDIQSATDAFLAAGGVIHTDSNQTLEQLLAKLKADRTLNRIEKYRAVKQAKERFKVLAEKERIS